MKVIHNMPNAEYHAHSAVSNSLLSQIARSPLHARAYLDGTRREQTAAMAFGSALHSSVLEPHIFASEYAVFEGDRRTKEGKAAYAELQESGRSIISVDDYNQIYSVTQAVLANPTAAALLTGGIAESSVFWTDEQFGVECKCRPDWMRDDGIIVDLKTSEDASPEGFAKSIAQYRYHVQAAHYLAGTNAKRFIFVVVEKKAPYAVAVYELDNLSLEVGQMLRESDLMTYAHCLKTGQWPGYSADIQRISIPVWAFPKDEVEEIEVDYV